MKPKVGLVMEKEDRRRPAQHSAGFIVPLIIYMFLTPETNPSQYKQNSQGKGIAEVTNRPEQTLTLVAFMKESREWKVDTYDKDSYNIGISGKTYYRAPSSDNKSHRLRHSTRNADQMATSQQQ